MHTLIDFKGFKAVGVDLLRPFTLLIGPNGLERPTSSKQSSCSPLSHADSLSMRLPTWGAPRRVSRSEEAFRLAVEWVRILLC